ncbi:MAG: hypothetical protein DRQ48_05275 [Gammaproteobacteria bacterium]|nr:MAG: hypothetical protein DRQ48_05275 [Gammaproteobacteria bacterium]
MNDYSTKSATTQNPPTILCECREIMTGRLKGSLVDMLDEVDDVLLDIALRTNNPEERRKYFNAMHEVRLKRHRIEKKCIENIVELFIEDKQQSDNRDIAVIDTGDIESVKDINIVAMENAINKARKNCSLILRKLDENMNHILINDERDIKGNPVSPEIVCMAFYNACELIDSGTEIKLIILKYFEKSILPLLGDIYLEINHVLETGNSRRAELSRVDLPMQSQQTSMAVDSSKNYQDIADIKQIVTSEIQNLLADQHAPEFVSDFLLNQWAKLLVRIHDKNGTNGDSWQHARETAEDLIWSVGTLSSGQDRDRFEKLWPDLVMRLRNGMKMISMPPHQETNFISCLFKHRASLSMLTALTRSKENDATLLQPEKINALKMNSGSGQVMENEKDLDSIGSEDVTEPGLRTHKDKRPPFIKRLFNTNSKEVQADSAKDGGLTIPGPKAHTGGRPFMDELLVDNFNIKGFKSDITGS